MTVPSTGTGDVMTEFRDAYETLREARRCYHEAFRKAFPVGSVVTSIKHGRVSCTIERHVTGDSCIVRSETGRRYSIDAYWIVEAGIRP